MPEKETLRRAREDKDEGKSVSTQAGEFVREEMHHVREGRHGARNTKQAIAIGLSKARRAGVELPSQPGQKATGKSSGKPNPRRSSATSEALKREGSSAASHKALSRQAHSSADQRGPAKRSAAAKKAAETKGAEGRHEAAVKAAKTRTANG